jgi:hypothetical protein
MTRNNLTWKDVVREALSRLGGEGHLSDINEIVEGHPKTMTNPTWRATIRRVVRQYRIFEALGGGRYKLRELDVPEAGPESFTEDAEADHGKAQGMLVVLGNIYGYETFVSRRDQNTRVFRGNPLNEYITVVECPTIASGPNQRKIREIDVIWFGEDDEGLYPIYAFEVEMTTGVKAGLDRLLKIPERINTSLYVIGPSEQERHLFDAFTNQSPFRRFKERLNFKLYGELEELYNRALVHADARESFGIEPCR